MGQRLRSRAAAATAAAASSSITLPTSAAAPAPPSAVHAVQVLRLLCLCHDAGANATAPVDFCTPRSMHLHISAGHCSAAVGAAGLRGAAGGLCHWRSSSRGGRGGGSSCSSCSGSGSGSDRCLLPLWAGGRLLRRDKEGAGRSLPWGQGNGEKHPNGALQALCAPLCPHCKQRRVCGRNAQDAGGGGGGGGASCCSARGKG